MTIENATKKLDRTIIRGRTPEAFFLSAKPGFDMGEAATLAQVAGVRHVREDFPNGDVELRFDKDALEGLQRLDKVACRVAEVLGNCRINPLIIPRMDPARSFAEH